MSSIKLFKKEINNSIGAFIEEVYAWELSHPDTDLKSTEKLVDKAIVLFDDLIEKIHEAKRKGGKAGFKSLRESLAKAIRGMEQELKKLG
ncbi:MAG: hypothetical protein P8I34_04785 [Flavobacteriaceae bacterium]|jgi:hypothetical protein|nr:hypothetical protein [Flavobacteriaceae bacterium]MDG1965935.1 hypothetical protein [Flavobacteriaceae bacterium]